LAVQFTEAWPFAPVVAVAEEGAQLAPEAGAENVTVAPLIGDPLLVTVATSGLEKVAPAAALCPLPLVAAIAMVVALLLELLLQPVSKPKARQTMATRRLA
jgi:hypothetical protein